MEVYSKLLKRDLDKLAMEISNFENEENLWALSGEIKNSAGNLCLHLVGNLNHFIGNVMGNSGYVRHRESEFATKGVSKQQLLQMITETKESVISSLQKWGGKNLREPYPIQVFGEEMTYEFFLVHLISHLNYHLGQINYLRRIIDAK